MTTDLIARIEQLQIELDEAQRIANNNHQLYTMAKAQRDELIVVLRRLQKNETYAHFMDRKPSRTQKMLRSILDKIATW